MLNYQVGYFWRAGDGGVGTLGCGMAFTLDEAQQAYSALTMGGSQDIPPTRYYVLLNKWNVLQWVSFFLQITAGGSIGDETQFTTDGSVAQSFSTENIPGGIWQSDTTDPKWQKNVESAEKRIVESGKTKLTTVHLTLTQILLQTYDTLRYQVKDLTRANLILDIYNLFRTGKISFAVASTRYEFILQDLIRRA